MTVEFRSADLADIVTRAVEETRPEAQRKHIELALSAAALPCFALDPERIAQLAGNLISNAVKFTPDGGRVEVRVGMQGDQAVLAVADTGIGIPAGDRERIFERFFRSEAATRKAIVAAHNGTIAVDSDEDRGSTFKICLPLRPLPAP
jgi:signal transduction histidine kinase